MNNNTFGLIKIQKNVYILYENIVENNNYIVILYFLLYKYKCI